jgi:ribose transport system substrate-binding protein
MKKIMTIVLAINFLIPSISFAEKKATYRFVLVPKDSNPWFEQVHEGAKSAAKMLEEWTGSKFVIEYRPPNKADVLEQNKIMESVIASRPDGISIDLLDENADRTVLDGALKQGIKVTIFDSVPPLGMELTSVGNDFCEQAKMASEKLVKLVGGKGEVAIMMGVPTAPNHMIRARCHNEVFKKYSHIKVVAKGVDNDEVETAKSQAIKIMQAHPKLKGWVSCDAAGPIGVGQAIKETGKVSKVLSVGSDDLPELVELIKEGVVESSTSTKPRMQGYWTVLALWQATMGINMPKRIDTGIAVITKEMAKDYKGY